MVVWVLLEHDDKIHHTRSVGVYLSEADAKDMAEVQHALAPNHTYYWESHIINELEA